MVRGCARCYKPCYVCGGDPTAVIDNPSGDFNGWGNCGNLYNDAIDELYEVPSTEGMQSVHRRHCRSGNLWLSIPTDW
jgi:hypothetical protein